MNENQILKFAVIASTLIALISMFLPWVSIYVPFIEESAHDIIGTDFINSGMAIILGLVVIAYSIYFRIDVSRMVYILTTLPNILVAIYGSIVITNRDNQVLRVMEQVGSLDYRLDRMLEDSVTITYGFWIFIIFSILGFVLSLFIKNY